MARHQPGLVERPRRRGQGGGPGHRRSRPRSQELVAGVALEQAGVNEELAGVLGVDILIPGKAIIDYGAMTLYLLPRE